MSQNGRILVGIAMGMFIGALVTVIATNIATVALTIFGFALLAYAYLTDNA